ncbi:ATP-binding protein [Asticcacaulis sp. SL142]|uniref:ATP-binding protein n=1 Tax=Asticcacaulis sp. SL142 TaxID=2995155 RepID=UPI00226CD07F|nr:ATP-binding protein [Asticcacaulis sp. SL142]WAC47269.1 ATP-binding protein [Asticcacaulis sp. SL142]
MRPTTLLRQTLAGTILIVILSQVLTIAAMSLLVVRPQIDRAARMMAQNVVTLTQGYNAAAPETRTAMIQRLKNSTYLEIWTGDTPPDRSGPPPRYMERRFMRALADQLDTQSQMSWRTDGNRKLWVQVYLGDDPYWISFKPRAFTAPNGVIIVLGVIAVALSSAMAYWLSRKLVRPLEDLRVATDELHLSSGPPALREDGPAEIAALSRSFNAMTARLNQADADRTLVLAGISHDLRTPLAKLRLVLDMADIEDADLRASAGRQIDTIERILSQFLQFARGYEQEPKGLIAAGSFMNDLGRDYIDRDVYFEASPGLVFTGRREALRRAVINLIENALRYGAVPVEVSACAVAGDIILTVRDQGAGFGADEAALYRQPFVRGDDARQPHLSEATGGTGLGLAMVDQIAVLHGGQLEFERSDNGFETRLVLKDALRR